MADWVARLRAHAAEQRRSDFQPSVRSFCPLCHPEHDDQAAPVVDEIDEPRIADPHLPEAGALQLRRAGRSGVESERQERATESSPIGRGEVPKLPLGGRCHLHPVRLSRGHVGSDPYLDRTSAAMCCRNSSAAMPPSRSYSASASAAPVRSSSSSRRSSHWRSASSMTSRTDRSDRAASTLTARYSSASARSIVTFMEASIPVRWLDGSALR